MRHTYLPHQIMWHLILGFSLCFLGIVLAPLGLLAAESGGGNVLFILDGSGSMWGNLEDKKKIAIAKEKMIEVVQELPAESHIGLEVYGHRLKGDCEDVELLVPVGPGKKAQVVEQIRAVMPKGKTPIAKALERAGASLATAENATTIVLVSDGLETCGGDPCEAARTLAAQGINVEKIHVVGFDIRPEERTQLQCIADAGNGQYCWP